MTFGRWPFGPSRLGARLIKIVILKVEAGL